MVRDGEVDASVNITPMPGLRGAECAGLVFWGQDEKEYVPLGESALAYQRSPFPVTLMDRGLESSEAI